MIIESLQCSVMGGSIGLSTLLKCGGQQDRCRNRQTKSSTVLVEGTAASLYDVSWVGNK
jgi:hypothetical protein